MLYEFTKNAFKQNSSKNKMVLPKIRKICEPVAIKVENFNECHPMSYTLQSWQIGEIDTPRKEALLTFMVSLMNQPVFDYLRKGIFIKILDSLTDIGEDSKLVHRRKRPKVDKLFSSFFFRRVRATIMTQRRVENTHVHFCTFSPVSVN